MYTQLTKGFSRRLMYIENKQGVIETTPACIGWVQFSRTGRTAYYKGRTLQRGNGISGNFFDTDTGEEYWLSGVKRRGSNAHPAERGIGIMIDADALEAYQDLRSG